MSRTLLLLLLAVAGTAHAGTYAVQGSGPFGGIDELLQVTFEGDGVTAETELVVEFSSEHLTIHTPTPHHGAQCLLTAPNRLRVIPPSGTLLPGSATVYCTYLVDVATSAFLTFFIPATTISVACRSAEGAPLPCGVSAASRFDIAQGVPALRKLRHAPAPGSTIRFAGGGNAGQVAPTQHIVVTSHGVMGLPSLSGCTLGGAAAAAFSVSPGGLSDFSISNPQTLGVGCIYRRSEVHATLDCVENDADSFDRMRRWNLVCPAGATIGLPGITARPAPGNPLSVGGGARGSLGTTLLDFTATGFVSGDSVSISCASTGNVRIALHPAIANGMSADQVIAGSDAAQDISIGVVLTDAPQTPAGALTCTATPLGGAATVYSYAVNAPAGAFEIPIARWMVWLTALLLAGLGAAAIARTR